VHITDSALSLNVADVEASASWAKRHLGFAPQMEADGFASLRHPQAGFSLIFLRTGLETFKPASVAGPADGLLVVFVVDGVDAEHARLVDEGATVVTPPETEPWGERYVQLVDPNGLVYQLVQWVHEPPA
jgi:catechol 2,3-dioxygenase-like lactoylglutathione lyase family enzyme